MTKSWQESDVFTEMDGKNKIPLLRPGSRGILKIKFSVSREIEWVRENEHLIETEVS
jgi:hypothetical protein